MSVQIPEFEGNLDPEEFIDWKYTVERIFDYEEVPEEKKSLQQVSSVSEYTREFERLLLQCDVQETQEQTIARYLRGLKAHIADAVELQHYWTFNDVRALAHKVEQQQTRRSNTRSFVKASPFNKGSSS
ncbi:hypothetical protein MLD38_027852 [Melastoma candidum]|uniref:Uncharacterized protein n=1 Tax=Melastoma candidum TaxID=119954 RepID=A0ACB9P337_9MYRT|nr:hypothetical protein MLD38_027852 [Melastoma candidum]